jgi:hypothetical protein
MTVEFLLWDHDGVTCVVVKNAFTASEDFSGARHVLDSVRELPKVLESGQTQGSVS